MIETMKKNILILFLLNTTTTTLVSALSMKPKSSSSERRQFLTSSSSSLFGLSSISVFSLFPLVENSNAAVLQSPGCASGLGDNGACEDLAEGNEYIRKLQQKSLENKEKYQKEALSAYNMKNYPDFFASLNPPRFLVMKEETGNFEALTEEELSVLRKKNLIRVEQPKAKGGKFTDLTQKPIVIWKNE